MATVSDKTERAWNVRHLTHHREVLACIPCRERKVRCDRKQPCKACQNRRASDSCVYVRAKVVSNVKPVNEITSPPSLAAAGPDLDCELPHSANSKPNPTQISRPDSESSSSTQFVDGEQLKGCTNNVKHDVFLSERVIDEHDKNLSNNSRMELAEVPQEAAIQKEDAEYLESEPHKSAVDINDAASKTDLEPENATNSIRDKTDQPRRITWTCSCGTELYDDYVERTPGALSALQAMLRAQKLGHLPLSTSHPLIWLTKKLTFFTIPASQPDQSVNSISMPAQTVSSASIAQSAPSSSNQAGGGNLLSANPSFLSASVGAVGAVTTLSRLGNHVSNDKEIFRLLRKVYASKRRIKVSWLWLKTVIRVSLACFLVDLPGYVELKHYSCRGTDIDCRCIPPKDLLHPSKDAQYHCTPQDPPFKPPIGTNYLTHYFQNDCIQDDQLEFVLNQVPKRLGQCMVTSGRYRLEAWGLEFEEGWDRGRLRNALFAIVVLGSLLFATLWSVFEKDVSSAFQMAGVAVTILTLVGGYVASAQPRVVNR